MRSLVIPLLSAASAFAQAPESVLEQSYDAKWSKRLVPLLTEVIRFPTYAGNTQAFIDQKAWLTKVAGEFGFTIRDKGKVTEIELPGPTGAPVLGLAVHGDVVPVDDHWTIPPFAGVVKDDMVLGRGSADDKGPLVQALLAMKTLADSGKARTHTIRLLVGSDEESGSTDMKEYLKDNRAPDYTLVLDSGFPVIVGERAWNLLTVKTPLTLRRESPFKVVSLTGGLAASIVPDTVMIRIEAGEAKVLQDLHARLAVAKLPAGTRIEFQSDGHTLQVVAKGRAAHAGVNAAGGRNAMTALAAALIDELGDGGARDLLTFARMAGQDIQGTGLGLTQVDPVFARVIAVPTLLRPEADGKTRLTINVRANPNLYGEDLKKFLFAQVTAFNARTGATLEPGGFFGSTPRAFDPQSKLVKRLLAAYERGTGKREPPGISGGSTYAATIPNSIAFGMWFADKPYPGHDVDEQISVADLQRGMRVLLAALADLASGEPISEPLKP